MKRGKEKGEFECVGWVKASLKHKWLWRCFVWLCKQQTCVTEVTFVLSLFATLVRGQTIRVPSSCDILMLHFPQHFYPVSALKKLHMYFATLPNRQQWNQLHLALFYSLFFLTQLHWENRFPRQVLTYCNIHSHSFSLPLYLNLYSLLAYSFILFPHVLSAKM